MATVTTIVEIAAPPALVRSLFLDFDSYPQWHSGHFKAINILKSAVPHPSPPAGEKLKVGDKLRISLAEGMKFKATVTENTAQRFVWLGGLPGVVAGEHFFQFGESTSVPGGTTLTHGETFNGGLVTICKPFMNKEKHQTSPNFERFNADLKKWAEKKHGGT